ncbi:MAG: hypothetical protein J3K34DRAFT_398802, partial [Monoraphidium minutum]
ATSLARALLLKTSHALLPQPCVQHFCHFDVWTHPRLLKWERAGLRAPCISLPHGRPSLLEWPPCPPVARVSLARRQSHARV